MVVEIRSSWTQPIRNFAEQQRLGASVMWGPELEGGSGQTAQQWCDAADKLGLKVITKNQTLPLPPNCIGFWHAQDEPNKTPPLPASAMQAEYNRLKAMAPDLPVYMSLAGDKLLYDNFPNATDRTYYLSLAKVCNAFWVNFYSKNRNANRYPTSQTAKAVKNLIDLCQIPVYFWYECNDQELKEVKPPDTDREPTPAEMMETVDLAMAAGALGFGTFGVCKKAKHGWPENYWPLTNRNGVSMQPQYDTVKAINNKYTAAPAPIPPVVPTNAELDQRLKVIEDKWEAIFKI